MSASLAVTAKLTRLPSLTVRLAIALSTGALFTSLTITVKVFASLKAGEPLSVTRIVIVLVLGPCASPGVQLNSPVDGLIDAPAGAPASRLNVSACAG